MPKYEVKIYVCESRYYTVEAENEDDAIEAARYSSTPDFIKNHDVDYDVTLVEE
jgi:hypothetical protein